MCASLVDVAVPCCAPLLRRSLSLSRKAHSFACVLCAPSSSIDRSIMSSRWRKLWIGITVASVVYNTSRLGFWPVVCRSRCALPSFGAGVRSVLNGIGTGGLGKHSGESMKPTLGSGLVLVRKFDYALPWFVPQLKHGDLDEYKITGYRDPSAMAPGAESAGDLVSVQ